MEGDESKTEVVKAQLDGGFSINIEATSLGGEERVAAGIPSFKDVTDTVEGLAKAMVMTLKKVKPRSASVEFGVQIGIESGKLTALLVKGTGNANLKITLEWGEISDSDDTITTDEVE
ncbi:MAG TPA: CU044_2847 family protein [Ktedonobacteraceae bacterium]|nr:CU044_2847 family protein [Ktedonobacteraceae bacterium]